LVAVFFAGLVDIDPGSWIVYALLGFKPHLI
jgi:hypothetical protein